MNIQIPSDIHCRVAAYAENHGKCKKIVFFEIWLCHSKKQLTLQMFLNENKIINN